VGDAQGSRLGSCQRRNREDTRDGFRNAGTSTSFVGETFSLLVPLSELLQVLQACSPGPTCSGKQIADVLVENAELRRDNDALIRRMHSALTDSARLNQVFATLVRERDEWKKSSDKVSILVSSFRKEIVCLECQLRASTQRVNRQIDETQVVIDALRRQLRGRHDDIRSLSAQLGERQTAYSALQGVASTYYQRVQEAVLVVSSGDPDHKLRMARWTIEAIRLTISQQKQIIEHAGRTFVTDPALALAAALGTDTPGLSPADLHLNAQLCRLLETRWP
jgi:hypothetical protein